MRSNPTSPYSFWISATSSTVRRWTVTPTSTKHSTTIRAIRLSLRRSSREPTPTEFLMDPEHAETARKSIANEVNSLVRSIAGVAEFKILQVKVIVEVCDVETDVELLAERMMTLVRTKESSKQEEACAVRLEDISVGEVMACTPCLHRFHAMCLRRWFENADSCPPVCYRTMIQQRAFLEISLTSFFFK
ncbi:hypothetical protein HPP92_004413 [Vanilla planifolia]|uniref:RING-type domain-containing protein n=1 Tax=Vanilla planifolia TaxID=51239 RepID=A0A835VAD0_VANPL|nr:hypothetical protein HPP92_004413 [Vanilla planifolia]